ncbi:hypothetical protein [Telmatospirillum sp.]|uniref:hypothetical protein n=1 Tax=Telmatospirillum sp. TaxID=2079197 RepID=UPI002850AE5D|nr:hypothetical protein [Telmatospirillum sp.]MDR3441116.1 hypothetical protein [Telmatospirillum sp.]
MAAHDMRRQSPLPPALSMVTGPKAWSHAGNEPRLADILADDIVCAVMAKDGISRRDILSVIVRYQKSRRN